MTTGTELERRQHVDAVLAERARQLARPVVAASVSETAELIEFGAGDERYAIEAACVWRLERLGSITPLPGAPRHFAGVTNLHGQLVPLIDLRVLLGATPTATPTFGLVLGDGRAQLAVVAETLLAMRTVSLDELGSHATARTLLRHILPDGSAVIDGAALMADPRLIIGDIVADGILKEGPQ
jgi:purine-binding chemotaxis protein CheW